MTDLDKIIKQIDPNKEYLPSEIASNGWIRNRLGGGSYSRTLKLIKLKKIKARNYANIKEQNVSGYWIVLGKNLIEYLNKFERN